MVYIRNNQKGCAAIIWILGIEIVVMLLLIFVPVYRESNKKAREEIDIKHEQTAYDSAKLSVQLNGPFCAIYDYYNKEFVTGHEAVNVEAYGESDLHKEMVILIEAQSTENIKMEWVIPREVPYDIFK